MFSQATGRSHADETALEAVVGDDTIERVMLGRTRKLLRSGSFSFYLVRTKAKSAAAMAVLRLDTNTGPAESALLAPMQENRMHARHQEALCERQNNLYGLDAVLPTSSWPRRYRRQMTLVPASTVWRTNYALRTSKTSHASAAAPGSVGSPSSLRTIHPAKPCEARYGSRMSRKKRTRSSRSSATAVIARA